MTDRLREIEALASLTDEQAEAVQRVIKAERKDAASWNPVFRAVGSWVGAAIWWFAGATAATWAISGDARFGIAAILLGGLGGLVSVEIQWRLNNGGRR